MKNLMSLVRVQVDLLEGESPFILKAEEELNELILALAKTEPYHKYPTGLSYACIHCGARYDSKADPLDAEKHHTLFCVWLQSYKLAELCQK